MTKPYKDLNKGKKEQVELMFDNIAKRYDFLNHFLSFGIDRRWRKKLRKAAEKKLHRNVLDIATGTGDLAIELFKIEPVRIVGVDLSKEMLTIAESKCRNKLKERNIELEFHQGDVENLRFENDTYELVTIAFGIRNFENVNESLKEILRVLKPSGSLMILEFSKPKKFPYKQMFKFYFHFILPVWGKLISGDNSAYQYLPASVDNFPEDKDFMKILEGVGFINISQKRLTGGVATLYISEKK